VGWIQVRFSQALIDFCFGIRDRDQAFGFAEASGSSPGRGDRDPNGKLGKVVDAKGTSTPRAREALFKVRFGG
jgi:hypothetical protein